VTKAQTNKLIYEDNICRENSW